MEICGRLYLNDDYFGHSLQWQYFQIRDFPPKYSTYNMDVSLIIQIDTTFKSFSILQG